MGRLEAAERHEGDFRASARAGVQAKDVKAVRGLRTCCGLSLTVHILSTIVRGDVVSAAWQAAVDCEICEGRLGKGHPRNCGQSLHSCVLLQMPSLKAFF